MIWQKILLALFVGTGLGIILNLTGNQAIAGSIKLIGTAFVSAIKMIIVPLIFVSLVCGMTAMTDLSRMGRIGIKTVAFYLGTTAFAIIIGLLFGTLLQPGAGLNLTAAVTEAVPTGQSFGETVLGIIPVNPVAAAANGNVLQIIFFAIAFGLATNLAGDRGTPVRDLFEALNSVVISLAELVISAAPYGVFALMAWVAGTYGMDVLLPMSKVIFAVYIGCILHAVLVYGSLVAIIARLNPIRFFQGILEPQMVAFTSTSSSGTLPVTMAANSKNLGVDNKIASFTLPLGATINMDGTALYQGVTALFVAQAYGVDLTMGNHITIVLTATLASIGTAGVPGGGLIMLSLVLTSVGLPLEGIAIIAGIDRILDMARTTLNVTGDCACTVLIAKSEDELNLDTYNTPHAL
ncbi:dicarboxylate/amino acid:cation symporter [Leisingera sp.]|uniref:dicarboxylate/amino acid:cation symporter n=1 Tax=Leisingera sp. TaxID=1879318 RepID=UPI002B270BB3|nr:dicarboxylate/amino acid:cation symporter [Leisingera sp.]